MFSSFSLFLPLFDLFSAMCGSGMLESMLESHLQHNAGASVIDVGDEYHFYPLDVVIWLETLLLVG